jgi:hypothetical protein
LTVTSTVRPFDSSQMTLVGAAGWTATARRRWRKTGQKQALSNAQHHAQSIDHDW